MPSIQIFGGKYSPKLPNGKRAVPVGIFARLSGYFSPHGNYILCEPHSAGLQPLQPAFMEDLAKYQWCPYCKGRPLAGKYAKHKFRGRMMRALRDLAKRDLKRAAATAVATDGDPAGS